MKARWPSKYRGAAYALAVVAIAAAAGVAGFKPVARFPATAASRVAAPDDAEARRAESAIADLARLAEMESSQPPPRSVIGEGVIALHSPALAAAAQAPVSFTDFSKSSVVILGTQRGTFAVIDGVVVRPGQRLPSGELVRGMGRAHLLVEDGVGGVRRVDIKDGFGGAAPAFPDDPPTAAVRPIPPSSAPAAASPTSPMPPNP
jgi:hypothetical protein